MTVRTALWCLTLTVACLAAATYAVAVGDPALGSHSDIPLAIALTVAFALAELLVVELQFRRNAHSFSLLEIPLVVGLLTAPPLLIIFSYAVGGGAVLLVHRRQGPLKLSFNIATFSLTAAVALAVYRTIPHPVEMASPGTWGAAYTASLAASSLGTLLVFVAIGLAERHLSFRNLKAALLFGTTTAAGATSVGIACALLGELSAFAVFFVAAPVLALYFANRAYMNERQRRENLQLLYDASRTLNEEPDTDKAVFLTLRRCRETLACDFAQVHLPSPTFTGSLTLRLDENGEHRLVGDGPGSSSASIESLGELRAARKLVMTPSAESSPSNVAAFLQGVTARPAREALVVPIAGVGGQPGAVVAGVYEDSSRHFTDGDLAAFETVCRHIGAHTRLAFQAGHDALTNLPNRRLLMHRLDAAFVESKLDDTAVLMVDLDDFKSINDTFGHTVGDLVLIQVAHRLHTRLGPLAVVSRLGGDEFAIVAEGGSSADWERLCLVAHAALAEPIESNGQTFSVGASIGLALGEDALNPSALLRNADTALYEAKRKGKGGTEVFSAPMHEKVARRYQVAEDLRHALSNGELRVAIQPIVSLADGKVVGGEALARWLHPTLGEITPTEFVRAAEEHGLSVQLTEVVLAQLRQVFFSCANATLISMNVSPGDLRHTELVASILGLAHEVAPHSLAIEVTESLLISDQDQLDTLRLFRERGIRVYIDDFGTGYSSLAYLKDVPADYLKVPREFVSQLTGDAHSGALTGAVVAIGGSLGLGIVAEGVETDVQRRALLQMGVRFAQGYLFSRAVETREFIAVVNGTKESAELAA